MTMNTIMGPAVFLAQFAADDVPYNSLTGLAKWAQKIENATKIEDIQNAPKSF